MTDTEIVAGLQAIGDATTQQEAESLLAQIDLVINARMERIVAAVLPEIPPAPSPDPNEREMILLEKLALGSATNPEKDAALKQAAADFKAALAMPDEPPTGGA